MDPEHVMAADRAPARMPVMAPAPGASESLGVRTLRNVAWRLASGGWRFVLLLGTTPIIVRGLGHEAYGVLVLVTSFVGYFVVLDLDLGTAVTKYVAEFNARGDRTALRSIVQAALSVFLVIGVSIALLVAALADLVATDVIRVSPGERDTARFGLMLGGAGFALMMPTWIYIAVLQALHRFDLLSKLSLAFGSLGPLGTAGLVLLGVGLEGILLWNLVWIAINLLAHLAAVRAVCPLAVSRPRFERHALRRIAGFGSVAFAGKVLGNVWYQSDRVLIGVLLSAVSVTHYSVPWRLVTMLVAPIAGLATSMVLPLASQLRSAGESERLHRMYLESSKLALVGGLAVAVPLLVFGDRILRLWVGPAIASHGTGALRVLVVGYVLITLLAPAHSTGAGIGKPSLQAVFHGGLAVLSLPLHLLLIPRFGVAGAAVALALPYALLAPLYLTRVARVIGLTLKEFLRSVLIRPISAAAVAGSLCWVLLRPWMTSPEGVAVGVVVGGLALALAMLATGAISKQDRTLLRAALVRRGLHPAAGKAGAA